MGISVIPSSTDDLPEVTARVDDTSTLSSDEIFYSIGDHAATDEDEEAEGDIPEDIVKASAAEDELAAQLADEAEVPGMEIDDAQPSEVAEIPSEDLISLVHPAAQDEVADEEVDVESIPVELIPIELDVAPEEAEVEGVELLTAAPEAVVPDLAPLDIEDGEVPSIAESDIAEVPEEETKLEHEHEDEVVA
jgi:hypothetical protein